MGELKAIQTTYRGYKFRSRIEARWAVFFDALDIKWEYEKEGYDLDGVWYLPDFWLPELNYWLEVKGRSKDELTDEEINKARLLLDKSDSIVVMVCGAMDAYQRPAILAFSYNEDGEICADENFAFVRCPVCGRAGLTWVGTLRELGCHCFDDLHEVAATLSDKLTNAANDADWTYWVRKLFQIQRGDDSPLIEAAFLTAQQARFEHGEQP